MSVSTRRRAVRAIAPVAGLLAAGLLVWQGSYAAFSATSSNTANAWTTGEVVAAAVTAVKCADPSTACQTKLINYLHQNTVETVVGPLSWDKDGRPLGAHMIQQFANGTINIVLPAAAKQADLVYPKPQW